MPSLTENCRKHQLYCSDRLLSIVNPENNKKIIFKNPKNKFSEPCEACRQDIVQNIDNHNHRKIYHR